MSSLVARFKAREKKLFNVNDPRSFTAFRVFPLKKHFHLPLIQVPTQAVQVFFAKPIDIHLLKDPIRGFSRAKHYCEEYGSSCGAETFKMPKTV